MITAAIDMGARTIKALVLQDGETIGRAMEVGGVDAASSARRAIEAALKHAGIQRADLHRVVAAGAGREEATGVDRCVTEISCAARGSSHLYPEVATVIDIGAEEGRAIRLGENGRVVDFAINEKCAAGSGAFTEAMARALEVTIDELGPLSLQSTKKIPMNAQCVVFAESEVVSMIHSNVPKPDMARAVHDAIALRVSAMVHKVGFNPPVTLIGGVARNIGFVESLKQNLELETIDIPRDVEFVVALGAALIAAKEQRGP